MAALTSICSREDLARARRIVIKAGTTVVSNEDGTFSLTRLGAIVEQASDLIKAGYEVILVTSGAVNSGRFQLRKAAIMGASFHQQLSQSGPETSSSVYSSACASAGQLGSIYATLFAHCDVSVSQYLVTSYDFTDDARKQHLSDSIDLILAHGMVPILNENDAVSASKGYTEEQAFTDNDSLASVVASQLSAELLLLLTDVEGLYDKPPSEPGASVIGTYDAAAAEVVFGEKSSRGRGGMGSKVSAALEALTGGVQAVVIASGKRPEVIVDVMNAKPVGTLFVEDSAAAIEASAAAAIARSELAASNGNGSTSSGPNAQALVAAAKAGGVALAALTTAQRAQVLQAVAQALRESSPSLLAANAHDLDASDAAAVHSDSSGSSGGSGEASNKTGQEARSADLKRRARLQLTTKHLEDAARGAEQLANMPREALGSVMQATELAPGLSLQQVGVPLGVCVLVFDDTAPPCIVARALIATITSGNGLLLAGGAEAARTHAALHQVVCDAVTQSLAGPAGPLAGVPLIPAGWSALVAPPTANVVSSHVLLDLLKLNDTKSLKEGSPDLNHNGNNGSNGNNNDDGDNHGEGLDENGDVMEGAASENGAGAAAGGGAASGLRHPSTRVDLVIPVGGSALIAHVQRHASSNTPVLGPTCTNHGVVCHTYVDPSADVATAVKVILDAKTNDPAALNATQTVLFHEATVNSGAIFQVILAMRQAKVSLKAGPKAIELGLFEASDSPPGNNLAIEYGDLTCLIEVVPSLDAALEHIHAHGSGHTECIIAEDATAVELFLAGVDAACAFHNASTRLASGVSFGLGADLGVSTGRIHARGPVGANALLTAKWVLREEDGAATVGDFAGDSPERKYTHVAQPVVA